MRFALILPLFLLDVLMLVLSLPLLGLPYLLLVDDKQAPFVLRVLR